MANHLWFSIIRQDRNELCRSRCLIFQASQQDRNHDAYQDRRNHPSKKQLAEVVETALIAIGRNNHGVERILKTSEDVRADWGSKNQF